MERSPEATATAFGQRDGEVLLDDELIAGADSRIGEHAGEPTGTMKIRHEGDVLAVNLNAAGGERHGPGKNPEQCALAGPVGADQRDEFTSRDGEVEAIERGEARGFDRVGQRVVEDLAVLVRRIPVRADVLRVRQHLKDARQSLNRRRPVGRACRLLARFSSRLLAMPAPTGSPMAMKMIGTSEPAWTAASTVPSTVGVPMTAIRSKSSRTI